MVIGHWSLVIGRALIVVAGLALTACEKPAPAPPPSPSPTSTPTPKPTPLPTPTPIPRVENKRLETSRLYSGLLVQSQVLAERSAETASQDRLRPDAYRLELTVRADVPAPSVSLAQITRNDPTLPAALSGLDALLATARVSPGFEQLYALKLDYLKSRLARLDALLSPHNFYDCETILELENPATKARALFLQGDMDVNTDGSDGDRNFAVDGSSMFFQPQTSYRWRRQTDRPNPFLGRYQDRFAKQRAELADPATPAARRAELRDAIKTTEAVLYELRTYSFLVAGADPYIVLPLSLLRLDGPFRPAIGDYAVVIHDGIAYPAILGDAGPAYKFGEASTRLCQQINPRSSAISRPVSNLRVTYLVFPGSREARATPPDLEKWRARCAELLAALGLAPARLHAWENNVPPWPTPTPTPTPSPSPAPSTTPSPAPSSGA